MLALGLWTVAGLHKDAMYWNNVQIVCLQDRCQMFVDGATRAASGLSLTMYKLSMHCSGFFFFFSNGSKYHRKALCYNSDISTKVLLRHSNNLLRIPCANSLTHTLILILPLSRDVPCSSAGFGGQTSWWRIFSWRGYLSTESWTPESFGSDSSFAKPWITVCFLFPVSGYLFYRGCSVQQTVAYQMIQLDSSVSLTIGFLDSAWDLLKQARI